MSNIENRVITNISKEELGDVFFANKEFECSEIPDFAVITGINGSGKTRLLKAINGKYSDQTFFKAANQKLSLETSHNQSNLDNIKYHLYQPSRLVFIRENIKNYYKHTLMLSVEIIGNNIRLWEHLKDPNATPVFAGRPDKSSPKFETM